jgi:hypothetical protein
MGLLPPPKYFRKSYIGALCFFICAKPKRIGLAITEREWV